MTTNHTNECCKEGNWDRTVVNEFDVEVEFTDWTCHTCGANVQDMATVEEMWMASTHTGR